MTPALPSPLAVVLHDAGAARLILPWLDVDQGVLRACVEGPARALWQQRFGTRGLVSTVEAALDGAVCLLSGTSAHANLEYGARLDAAALGLHSVAVIDHWVDYAARFQRDGHRVLPTEIWVCDAEAYALAQATFNGHDIRLQPNLYLRQQIERLSACGDPRRYQTVLLLPEPVGAAWGGETSGEEQALDFLVDHAHRLGLRPPLSLRLRPHDQDPSGRWDDWVRRQQEQHQVVIETSPTVPDAIDRVAWVAGLESVDLVLAQAAGRRVVCLQPPGAPRARLPQRGLIHLRDLVTAPARR
jgi:hypothetical protein